MLAAVLDAARTGLLDAKLPLPALVPSVAGLGGLPQIVRRVVESDGVQPPESDD